jgi:TLC domain
MDRIIPILISFAIYSISAYIIYKLVEAPINLQYKEKKDYLGQHLSILHAYSAIIASTCVYLYEGGIDYNARTNSIHLYVISVRFTQNSLGYFIFDTIYGELHKLNNTAMRFHHLCALLGLIVMELSTIGGSASICNINIVGLWLTEISNPCILKRNILGSENKQNSRFYCAYEKIFVFLFITMRLGWGTLYLLKVWESQVSWTYIFVASSIYAVSLFWAFVIVCKVLKKFNTTTDVILSRIMLSVKCLRKHKGSLLTLILMISFGMPFVLTKVLKFNYLQVEVDGFKIM